MLAQSSVDSGGGELQIEDTRFRLCPPLAIFIPPLVVHGFEFHPGTEKHSHAALLECTNQLLTCLTALVRADTMARA